MNVKDPKQYTNEMIEKLKTAIKSLKNPSSINFASPMTLPEIVKFEVMNHVRITDDFREWLKFSAGCSIENGEYQIFFPYTVKEFDSFVSADEVAVGGIRSQNIFFSVSKSTGHFSKTENGTKESLGCFGEIIDIVAQYLMERVSAPVDNRILHVSGKLLIDPVNTDRNTSINSNSYTSYNGAPNFVLADSADPYEIDRKIEKIQNIHKQFTNSYPSYFDIPANDSEIEMIEKANRVIIPLTYKKWLKKFRCCSIFGDTFRFFLPESSGYYNDVVPGEYLVIGEIVGDGERICISKKTGKIVALYHDAVTEYDDFEVIIDAVLQIFDDFSDSESYSNIIDPNSDSIKIMSDRELYNYIMKPKPQKFKEAQTLWNEFFRNNEKRLGEFISYLKQNKQKDRKKAFRNNYFEEILFMLRVCAVKDFWNNERELICHGKGTVNWCPEQQIRILNKNNITGIMSKNAVPGIVMDDNRDPVVNMSGMNVLYDAHQMYDAYHYPQYAADWRNIQALTPCEHIIGAHGIRYT